MGRRVMRRRGWILVLCAAMLLTAAACGGKEDEGAGKKAAVPTAAPAVTTSSGNEETQAPPATEAETTAAPETEEAPAYATMEEFAASDEIKNALSQQQAGLEGTGLTVEITGDGNQLIYTFTCLGLVKANQEDGGAAVIEQLNAGLDAQADAFIGIANSLKDFVDVEQPVVVVRYVDMNGEEFVSREFPAE